MRAQRDRARAALEEELDRRQRRADPGVVLDIALRERDVEVGAQEDALPLGRRLGNGAHANDPARSRAGSTDRRRGSSQAATGWRSFEATNAVMSASRHA